MSGRFLFPFALLILSSMSMSTSASTGGGGGLLASTSMIDPPAIRDFTPPADPSIVWELRELAPGISVLMIGHGSHDVEAESSKGFSTCRLGTGYDSNWYITGEKDVFGAGESIALGAEYLNLTAERYCGNTWKRPDGSIYWEDVDAVRIPDPSEHGYDRWDWYNVVFSYEPMLGSMQSVEGRWQAQFWDQYSVASTKAYTVMYLLTDHTMCRSVQSSDPWDYIDPTYTFDSIDARAYAWIRFDDYILNNADDVTFRWIGPAGHYLDVVVDVDPYPSGSWWDWYKLYSWIAIDGDYPSSQPGAWSVEVYVKDYLGVSELVLTENFTIVEYCSPDPPVGTSLEPTLVLFHGPEVPERFQLAVDGGLRVPHLFPPYAAIIEGPPSDLASWTGVQGVYRDEIDPDELEQATPAAQFATAAWNSRFSLSHSSGIFDEQVQARENGALISDARVRPDNDQIRIDADRSKRPSGASYYDTSEFMAGSVAVGIFLVESDGSQLNWSSAEQTSTLNGIYSAMDWWANQGGTAADLSFVYDVHLGVPTSYEPTLRPSTDEALWIAEALASLGYNTGSSFERADAYNNAIRDQFGTEWAFSIFVVDSDDSINLGRFTDDRYAWAYYGGPWMVLSRFSSWAFNSLNYQQAVPAHELGHIFYATDEYNSTAQNAGYLNVTDNDGACCIMNENSLSTICEASRQQIGWRDTNGNGILDILDTTPATSLSAFAPDPTTDTVLTLSGSAFVQPIANLNPYGSGNHITLNTISEVEFDVDGSGWVAANPDDGSFDEGTETYSILTPTLTLGTHLIEARAINSRGVVDSSPASDEVTIESPFSGVVYVDADAGGANDGTSWVDAFTSLQDALAVPVSQAEIWVAEGEYSPTVGTDRTMSFHLVNGLSVYGGFAGWESNRSERNWEANETILSGAIGAPDQHPLNITDDVYHVVTAENIDASTIVDGLTIKHGATGPGIDGGAGLRIVGGAPTIRNCRISNNLAYYQGAGVYIGGAATPLFENVLIGPNAAGHSIGGVQCSLDARPVFEGVTFQGNFAPFQVGGVRGTGTFIDCEFIGNSCDEGPSALTGGGTLTRVLFSGNQSAGAAHSISCTMFGGGTLTDVRFEDNWAQGPLGIGGLQGSGNLTNVTFLNNTGGSCTGMLVQGPSSLVNVLATSGQSFGIPIWIGWNAPCSTNPSDPPEPTYSGPVTLINCTIIGRAGSAGYGAGLRTRGHDVVVQNSILLGNVDDYCYPPESFGDVNFSTVTFSHSMVLGSGGSGAGWNPNHGTDLGGNLDLHPLFVDTSSDDYGLLPGSPGVDAGDDMAVPPTLAVDLAGGSRIFGDHVDMGAYELQVPNTATYDVLIGPSWDGMSLQEILDSEYGAGRIDAANDYEGAQAGDAVVPYWVDDAIDGWIVRELAESAEQNEFGWYAENFGMPTIDGTDDGLIFDGSEGSGATTSITLPAGVSRFGFYLNPNGPGDGANAPEPEHFFTNRFLNDVGPDGSGALHVPENGDVQCLIYNVTSLRGGVPTYVLAWEERDSGAQVTTSSSPSSTDNDFQDLVVEIRATSPVSAVVLSLQGRVVGSDIELSWNLENSSDLQSLEILRKTRSGGTYARVVSWVEDSVLRGSWMDTGAPRGVELEYVAIARGLAREIRSEPVALKALPPATLITRLVRAVPNPFNPLTTIEYVLADPMDVRILLFDVAGRLVRTIELGTQPSGTGAVEWNGRDGSGNTVSSGVYLARLIAGQHTSELRLVLVK